MSQGHLSKQWDMAQGLYYIGNPDTRDCKYFSSQRWIVKTCGSFLDYSLGLWRDRCGIKYGVTETEKREILKEKVVSQVKMSYVQEDRVSKDFFIFF